MYIFSRRFALIALLSLAGVFALNSAYRFAAMNGYLGDDAQTKYEQQTKGDKSIMRLLLGGRGEPFAGLLACRDKPIIGWGPWAMDTHGYWDEFLLKYGTVEDYEQYQRLLQWYRRTGRESTRLIQCHSYIVEFWVWYGIFGLVFWLYVLFILFRYLKEDCWAVPQWFAWLACSIPGACWGVFFSPFADRVGLPVFITATLMARAVRKGSFVLPMEMQREIAMSK